MKLDPSAHDRLATVFEQVFALPREKFNSELTGDSVTNWDSLRHLRLVVAIEKEFGIRIRARDIGKLNSVPRILELLREQRTETA